MIHAHVVKRIRMGNQLSIRNVVGNNTESEEPMNKNIRSHVFRGKRYRIEFVAIEKGIKKLSPRALGTCSDPYTKDKTITIEPDISDRDLLKVAIDEGIHACVWDFDNTAVDQMSQSISDFLWRLGFRKTIKKFYEEKKNVQRNRQGKGSDNNNCFFYKNYSKK
jgi:hypothetical protein